MNSEVEIVSEINKDYNIIKYLDLEVIRMKCNNFINVLKFRFWLYNKQIIELFDKILKTKNNQINKSVIKILTIEIPVVRIIAL